MTDRRVRVPHPVSLMPIALTRDPKISTNAKAMYCAIRSHAEGDGTNAFPRIAVLAGYLGMSLSTAKRAVKEIEEAGWIVVQHRHDKKGYRTSSLYTCLLSPKRGRPKSH